MKKFVLSFLFLLTILSINIEARSLNINGKVKEAVDVNLNINGVDKKSPTPSFVIDGVTYVPVRFVSETLGYKVEWIHKTSTVGIHGDKTIWFPVGKNFVNMGNGRVETPKGVMALLINVDGGANATTYVPVRYLSEYMGKKVGWIQKTRTVTIADGKEKDETTATDLLDGPEITTPPPTEEIVKPKEETVGKVTLQAKNVDYDSSTVKLIFTFNEKPNYEVKVGETSTTIIIKNADVNKSLVGQDKSMIQNSDKYIIQKQGEDLVISFNKTKGEITVYDSDDGKSIIVTDTFLFSDITKENVNGKESIVIKNMGKQNYNKMILEKPKRIILDFMDSNMASGHYKEFPIELAFVKYIRSSQFIPDKNYKKTDRIVRVVFDIDKDVEHPNLVIKTVGNDLVVTPERTLYDNFKFRTSGTTRNLTIKGITNNLPFNYDQAQNRITINVGGRIPNGSIKYNDSLVKDLDVTDGVLTINLLRAVSVNVDPQSPDMTLNISRVKTGKNSDYFILLDPGHGGTDPGAIHTPSGVKEVDVIKPIQRLLESKLVALGYRVQKTNDTEDSYIELSDRVKMSNNLKPDVFISIHADIVDYGSAKGATVYYYSSASMEPNQKEFGQMVVNAIERAIGEKTRGLKVEKYYVLKNTKAPAILIETGFLSNAAERAKLLTPEYQAKLVDGIINGIEDFLEEYR
ncbi:N-acetylmuramoyl-L-alanine amidase [Ezakiella coagulans]|uniref:N-acetylmuramoyl-L-alanine amidase n=1 Tax=Ezakiella coagulans TaxID=46507 RepID=UPI002889AEC9|nr:N-acetylmuramoyl-L-alanine amidase [Ezakiella coagulans]